MSVPSSSAPRRRLVLALLLASTLTAASAAVVQADTPFREHFAVDETFPEEVCGVAVETHVVERVIHLARADQPFIDIHQGTVTFSDADGDWVELTFRGPVLVTETLNPDGTLTVAATNVGIAARLRTSSDPRPSVVFDRGILTRVITIDLGAPENPEDDVVLSVDVTFVAGPHPELESDFGLFCDVVIATLG